MPPRTVVFTDHDAEIIERLVKSGRYRNPSEVLRDGLRLIERRDALEAAKLAAPREAAEADFRDIEEGHFQDVGDGDIDGFIGGVATAATDGPMSAEIEDKVADAMEIGRHYASQPLVDDLSAEEILGYDNQGIPS